MERLLWPCISLHRTLHSTFGPNCIDRYVLPNEIPMKMLKTWLEFIFTGSIYSTLAVAIERYVSVCHPHFVGYSEAGKLSVAGLILFSLVFNICRFLEFETTYEERVSFDLKSLWLDKKKVFLNRRKASWMKTLIWKKIWRTWKP